MPEDAFKRLLEWLDAAVERQENILALCVSQGEAARARDLAVLEARTAALQLLIQEAAMAEYDRAVLLAESACAIGLAGAPTLGELASVAPMPWAGRLREQQTRLRGVLSKTRLILRENNFIVRKSLHRINQVFEAIAPRANFEAPMLMNAQG